MADEGCLAELREAVRALRAVEALLTGALLAEAEHTTTDPVIDALATLEAARTARAHTSNLVMYLTERAMRQGASFASLGFRFVDPYE
jgi:hypothetical protein